MRKLTEEEIIARIKKTNPKLTLDFSTFINTKTKAKFFEEGYGEFWATPKDIISGHTSGHPSSAIKRRKGAVLKKYGVEHPLQSYKVRDKIKKTNLSKYGVEYALQNPKIRGKGRDTNLKKYGVEYSMQNPGVKMKAKQTFFKKYGVENPLQSPEIKARIKKTNLDKYGFENPFYNPEIQARARVRAKETNLERYGFEHHMQNSEVQARVRQTIIDGNYASKGELEIREFLESLGVKTKKIFLGGNPGMEIDIVCPDYGIAIEYNGDYWHSERNKHVHSRYHLDKTVRCKENGLQLIHVFDSEWNKKRDIMQDFLKAKFGIFSQKLMARKLKICEVSASNTCDFFNKNHLQGSPIFWKTWGLYQGDELVAAAAFSKPHRQNIGSEPHLSRFACRLGTSVAGGLSRLCAHAYKEIGPFVSYVHLRLSNGDSYLKAGFRLVGTTKPDYWYWDSINNKVVSKQSRRKSAVNTVDMTEKEHATIDGLFRIWDCGKNKYLFDKQHGHQ